MYCNNSVLCSNVLRHWRFYGQLNLLPMWFSLLHQPSLPAWTRWDHACVSSLAQLHLTSLPSFIQLHLSLAALSFFFACTFFGMFLNFFCLSSHHAQLPRWCRKLPVSMTGSQLDPSVDRALPKQVPLRLWPL